MDTLEDETSRPSRARTPTSGKEIVEAIRGGRERYPRGSKEKIAVLLCAEGWDVLTSIVGRILTELRAPKRRENR